MPSIAEMAHTTISGKSAGELVGEDTIEVQGWLLWKAAVSHCELHKAPPMTNHEAGDAAGFRHEGSLLKFVRVIWPESNGWNERQIGEFTRPIYAWLAASKNAVCVVKSTQPVWWVRKTFHEVPVAGSTPSPRTERERKVTPREAGEDRTPGEVTVTKTASVSEPVKRDVAKAVEAGQTALRRRMDARNNKVLTALIRVNRPITANQAARLSKVSAGQAQGALRDLVAAGVVVDCGGPGRGGGLFFAADGAQDNPKPKVKDLRPHVYRVSAVRMRAAKPVEVTSVVAEPEPLVVTPTEATLALRNVDLRARITELETEVAILRDKNARLLRALE